VGGQLLLLGGTAATGVDLYLQTWQPMQEVCHSFFTWAAGLTEPCWVAAGCPPAGPGRPVLCAHMPGSQSSPGPEHTALRGAV